jgi:hypothetical protein
MQTATIWHVCNKGFVPSEATSGYQFSFSSSRLYLWAVAVAQLAATQMLQPGNTPHWEIRWRLVR